MVKYLTRVRFGMNTHNLVKNPHGWTCSVCSWRWKNKPSTECPGVPRYDWWNQNEPSSLSRPVPIHLKTKTQLALLKKAPRDEDKPDGCIYRQAKTRWLWLYDERNAIPLRTVKRKRNYVNVAERRIRNEALALWDSGSAIAELYRDIEITVYPTYRRDGFKSPDKISKERLPYYYGFLAEVALVRLPVLLSNRPELQAILKDSVDTHIMALAHAKTLVDKLLDVGIDELTCDHLSQFSSGFIFTSKEKPYGFCLKEPSARILAHRLAIQFGWEVIEAH